MIQLRLFGGVSLEGDQGPAQGRSAQRRRLALLAILATARRSVSRDKLAGYLWGDNEPERARRLLSESLYVLRKALGEEAIIASGDDLRLNEAVVRSDIAAFEEALEQNEDARAVEYWGGPFLDGFYVDDAPDFERWTDGERDRLGRLYTAALERLANRSEKNQDWPGAARYWRALAEHDPLKATTALGLMRALDASGDRAGALRHARAHADMLRTELEAEPDPSVEAFAEQLREAPTASGTTEARTADARRAQTSTQPAMASPAPPSELVKGAPVVTDPAIPLPLSPTSALSDPSRTTASVPQPPPAAHQPGGTRSRSLPPAARWLLALIGLGIIGFVIYTFTRPARTNSETGVTGRASVAVLPFTFHGSAAYNYLAQGLVDLLSTGLDGAGDLRSVDPHALLSYVALQERSTGAAVDQATVAQHFSADFFVAGDIVEAGARLRITASLFDRTRPGAPLARASAEGTPDQLFSMVDDVTAQLLAGRNTGPGKRLARIAGLTTRSLPALKSYLEGEQDFRAARYSKAAEEFASAVTLDPSFALADYRLSAASEWSFDFQRARRAAARAVQNSSRLSDHDERLLGAWSNLLNGAADQAERQYNEILTSYPDDVEAWSGLGEVLVHYNPVRGKRAVEAKPAFEHTLALDPDYGEARFHLLEFAAARHDSVAFDSLVARVSDASEQALSWHAARAAAWGTAVQKDEALASLQHAKDVTIGIAVGRVASQLHDFPAAERIAQLLVQPQRTGDWRAAGHIILAELALARGRWSGAQTELARARPLERDWAMELGALYAALSFVSASRADMLAVRTAVSQWDPSKAPPNMSFFFAAHADVHRQLRLYLLGLLSARLGDNAAASTYATELERAGASAEQIALARALASSVRAQVAAAAGNRAEAISLLEATRLDPPLERIALSPFFSRAYDRFALAELLSESGREQDALRLYSSLEDGFDFAFAAPAHLREAQIYDRLGDKRAAVAHYAEFIALWRDADPALQSLVANARGRLGALTGATR